jgi:hypothetical protein
MDSRISKLRVRFHTDATRDLLHDNRQNLGILSANPMLSQAVWKLQFLHAHSFRSENEAVKRLVSRGMHCLAQVVVPIGSLPICCNSPNHLNSIDPSFELFTFHFSVAVGKDGVINVSQVMHTCIRAALHMFVPFTSPSDVPPLWFR